MCNNNNNEKGCSCFNETLSTIVKLQRQGECIDTTLTTCDRPFLGMNPTSAYNTRPVTLYNSTNEALTFPYEITYNGQIVNGTSSVLRIEKIDGCCATFRVLAENPDGTSNYPYVATDSFCNVNCNCICCLTCLPDTFVDCI